MHQELICAWVEAAECIGDYVLKFWLQYICCCSSSTWIFWQIHTLQPWFWCFMFHGIDGFFCEEERGVTDVMKFELNAWSLCICYCSGPCKHRRNGQVHSEYFPVRLLPALFLTCLKMFTANKLLADMSCFLFVNQPVYTTVKANKNEYFEWNMKVKAELFPFSLFKEEGIALASSMVIGFMNATLSFRCKHELTISFSLNC